MRRVARTPPVAVYYLRESAAAVRVSDVESDASLKRDKPSSMSCLRALTCTRPALDHKVIIIIIIIYIQCVSIRSTLASSQ